MKSKTQSTIKGEKMKKELSNCCKAKLITNYGEEGTNCYWCDKCLKPADIYIGKEKKEDLTEGVVTLKKLDKGYIIHIAQPLGFSSELALTEKELLALERLIKNKREEVR